MVKYRDELNPFGTGFELHTNIREKKEGKKGREKGCKERKREKSGEVGGKRLRILRHQ